MCFSAGASFAAGAVLSAVGIGAIRKSATPPQIIFASIPLIFAVQQFTEGFLWLALTNSQYASWEQPGTYIFLMFAQVVWPTWVPYALLLLEPDQKRKRILKVLFATGVLVSLTLALRLFIQDAHAEINNHHMLYQFLGSFAVPTSIVIIFSGLYVSATIVPCFVSSIRNMWYLSVPILISYIVSQVFYARYFTSVWCYFAAIISFVVLYVVFGFKKPSLEKLSLEKAER